MDATLVGDVPNGTTAGFVNTQRASGWTIFFQVKWVKLYENIWQHC